MLFMFFLMICFVFYKKERQDIKRKQIKNDLFQFNKSRIFNERKDISIDIPSPSSSPFRNKKNSFWNPVFTFEFGIVSLLKRYFFSKRHQPRRPLQVHRNYDDMDMFVDGNHINNSSGVGGIRPFRKRKNKSTKNI